MDSTFKSMDMDNSGQLSELEVYCGVLMLYTKIIAYCPTAVPPPKEVVFELVKDLDANNSGSIDEAEFKVLATVCTANLHKQSVSFCAAGLSLNIVQVLCKNVASRVAVEMTFALIVGPLVASIVLWIVDAFVPPLFAGVVPAGLIDMVMSLRTTITVAIVLATVVPKLLARIDMLFDLPSADQKAE